MKKVMLFCSAMLLFSALQAQVLFSNGSAGLQTINGVAGSDLAVDMNGDGLDDVVRVNQFGNIYIDYQQPGGGFNAEQFTYAGDNWPSWSICAADIDDNGYTDLVLGDGSALSFVYANDDGTAYTESAQPQYIFTQRTTFCDIDNDGNLDAFACHDVDQCRPYRNTGGVLTYDLSLIETLDVGGNYAAIWVDYDNDWDPDLYITKCRGGAPPGDPQRINLLYRNDGGGVFTSVGPEANMDDGDQSWTTCFEDFDNDGDFDAFTVNHEWANRLMRNNGDGTFTDVIEGSGIDAGDLGSWDCDAHDFDNNGFVDILSEMNNEIYWNNGDGTFTGGDAAFQDGGVGDLNNDGFLDVIRGNSLWLNNGNSNNWVRFDLEGIMSNRDGIGARIEIYGDWGIQIREVRAGESFSPGNSLIAHFGLGTATAIDQAVIKWPGGMITTLINPAINTTHEVAEVGCSLPSVTISAGGPTEICPGESVNLLAPAGDAYLWSNGATTQSISVGNGGNYSVLVFDEEGCAASSNHITISVIDEEAPVIAITGETTFCEGETVALTSSIAATYAWSNGATEQGIVVSDSGTYSVAITGACSGETYESQPVTLTMLENPPPVVDAVTLPEPGTAVFTATGNNLEWYATETSDEVLGTGPTFETDFFSDAISYWVSSSTEYGGELEEGGKPDNSGSGGLPSSGGRLFFNATEPFTLLSVDVVVPGGSVAGNRTIQLFDAANTVIAEAVFMCEIGLNTLMLDFEVPAAAGLSITCAENNLFRNNGGISYPYAIGTAGEIYTSTNGTGFYYYCYNWQIQREAFNCVSERVEATAAVVGMNEQILESVQVFPNPAFDMLTIKAGGALNGTVQVRIRDIAGKVVYHSGISISAAQEIGVGHLAAGIYTLELSNQAASGSVRFVKH